MPELGGIGGMEEPAIGWPGPRPDTGGMLLGGKPG